MDNLTCPWCSDGAGILQGAESRIGRCERSTPGMGARPFVIGRCADTRFGAPVEENNTCFGPAALEVDRRFSTTILGYGGHECGTG